MSSEGLISSASGSRQPDTAFAVVVAVLFACICGLAMSLHEMWRDELQAWLIARDSNSLGQLREAMRPEGHTAIWYLLLYFITRLTHRPEAMQLLHLAIGTGCAFVLARAAPFSRWTRVALCIGYFPVYEYGVIARNYSIGILFLLLAAALLPQRRERPWLLGLLLALAAHSNGMALIVATAFAVAVFVEAVFDGGGRKPTVSALKTCVVAGAGVAAALIFFHPPADSGFVQPEPASDSPRLHYERVLGHLAEAAIPITSGRDAWGSFGDVLGTHHASPLLALVVVACVLPYLLRCKVASAMVLAGWGALFWFFHAKLDGSLRHYGFFLVNLLLAVWYARVLDAEGGGAITAGRGRWFAADRVFAGFVGVVLFIQAAFALVAVRQEISLVFSAGRATAALLVANHLDRLPIVGEPDTLMTSVLGYLPQRTFYFPRGDYVGSYTIFRPSLRGPEDRALEEVLSAAKDLAQSQRSAVAVVLERRNAARVGEALERVGCVDADITKIESYCVFVIPAPANP